MAIQSTLNQSSDSATAPVQKSPSLFESVNLVALSEPGAVFPHTESSTLEFKRGLHSCSLDKIYATLCGFLNNEGGHLIFGVEDDTYKICPIQDNKGLDIMCRNIDSITSNRLIITSGGKNISPTAIKCFTIKLKTGSLLVVRATPSPDTVYTTSDGTQWYRLSASNYRMTSEREIYTRRQMEEQIECRTRQLQDIVDKMKDHHKTELKTLRTKLADVHKDYKSVIGAAKTMEKEVSTIKSEMKWTNSMLHTIILKQKEEAEAALEAQKHQHWWTCLFAC